MQFSVLTVFASLAALAAAACPGGNYNQCYTATTENCPWQCAAQTGEGDGGLACTSDCFSAALETCTALCS